MRGNLMLKKIPAVSVIIPLYNAEKYIGECLDSLFAQTFKDFEVIVVDDCSTDNSVEVVKNYAPKFKGRLKLIRRKKNSGGPGIPSDLGLKLSRGEYIFFMDNDDEIISTAFEKLYAVAKNFNADVVHCEKYYKIPDNEWHTADRTKLKPCSNQKKSGFVTAPTLLENNLEKFVVDAYKGEFLPSLWTRLIKRDFIFENGIKMMHAISQDRVFNLCLLYSGGRHVRVPYIINYYRLIPESMSHKKDELSKHMHKWIDSLNTSFNYLEEFLSGREFFISHPDFRQVAMETLLQEIFYYLNGLYAKIPAYSLNEILRKEFSNCSPAVTAFFFSMSNVCRLKLMQAQKRIAELEAEIKNLKDKG